MKCCLCDFCKHDTAPSKPVPVACAACSYGSNFDRVDKMHPAQESEWGKLKRVDEIIESLDIDLLQYQRLVLYEAATSKRPIYFRAYKDYGRTWMGQLLIQLLLHDTAV